MSAQRTRRRTAHPPRDGAAVPILMYHAVAETPARYTRRLSVHPAMLAAQLDMLCAEGFEAITVSELADGWRGRATLPQRPVVLTFDDGYADFHREVLPLLTARDMRATLFATTGWIDDGEASGERPASDAMLTWAQLIAIADAGVEVGAHSDSHPQLDGLPVEELRHELRHCRDVLQNRLGRPVTTFAYPFGYSSALVRRETERAGYDAACAVRNQIASPRQSLYALARLTVRRSTQLQEFERIIHGRDLRRLFFADVLLTKGYWPLRRAQSALGRTARRRP